MTEFDFRPVRRLFIAAGLILALAFGAWVLFGQPPIPVAATADPQPYVTLGWGQSADAVGYRLYKGEESGLYSWTNDMGNVTTVTDTDVVAGVTYYYAVTAVASNGLESLPSNEAGGVASVPVSPPADLNVRTLAVLRIRIDDTTGQLIATRHIVMDSARTVGLVRVTVEKMDGFRL